MSQSLPDAAIFREYDVRGVVGANFGADEAALIARAFAETACDQQGQTMILARDGRLSSPEIAEAVAGALVREGAQVIDIGMGPTPMLYFAVKHFGAAGGIMITGSHNPPNHNGMKFMPSSGAFYGAQIQSLRQRIASGAFSDKPHGTLRCKDIGNIYCDRLLRDIDVSAPLRIGWDAGNGATGEIMTRLCQRLSGEHWLINERVDGRFPAHHPDPTIPENLAQLIALVRDHTLDAGIAFDGDGDRIGVVDDEGEIWWGDQLLMLFARDILKQRPGATVIADVKASGALFDDIAQHGGQPLMWKTGHSLIKSKMAQTGAPLAGEMSGHLFFADHYYGFDDALYAAVRLVQLLASQGQRLSDIRKQLPSRISTPEIRFPCDDARKFHVIDEVKTRLTAAHRQFNDVDGIRLTQPHGWWLLRASNTQPMLVARCEAISAQALAELKEDLRNQLALSMVALP
ncbi:MAG: phosphomannomutase/phosphoglucomutase [Alphaproteobacteria bacterium]|nr:phosphomannomutase/phosphoglucomutase [Alphaproteobacteria bacterium]